LEENGPRNRWDRLVDQLVAAGKTRRAAIQMLTRRYPKLHVEMLREVNATSAPALRYLDRRFGEAVQ